MVKGLVEKYSFINILSLSLSMAALQGGGVLHHISKRKRGVDKSPHTFPAKSNAIRIFDRVMMVVAVINPLLAIPQITHIFSLKNAAGLSLISWAGYALFNIPWLVYGFIHKEKPLIIAYILAFLFNLAVVAGIVLYG